MIRIAFAGFRHSHILALYGVVKESTVAQLVGAYEADAATREKTERESGVVFTYESYESLLADETVDAVAIGDYYAIRGARVIEALQAGKHVISDKPLCTEQSEAEQIARLAREKGLCVYLMLDLRFDPKFGAVKRLVAEGAIGKLAQIRFGGQHPLLRDERPSWYFEEGKHGGTINDIAIHGIDAVRYLCGISPVRIVGARSWNAFAEDVPHFLDSGMLLLEMEEGVGLMADVSYASPDGMRYALPFYWEFELWGLSGMLRFGRNLDSVELYRKESDRVERIVPAPIGKTMLEDFVAAVRGEGDTVLTTEEVLSATEWALKIQAASEG